LTKGYFPVGFPLRVTATAAFFIDDFSFENGATLVVPGSHKMGPPIDSGLAPNITTALTGKAGSMAIWEGRLHHATGLNRTKKQRRRGVLATYVAPFIRGQENWTSTLSRKTLKRHPELAQLTGFEKWQTLGAISGTKTKALNF
jgi:ectoine hydroxylase-related dioxygenase (phytanoyl-CoA dioxygenase family)